MQAFDPDLKYAKLARPRLHETLLRKRLFDQLDAMRRRHAVIWVASPPGAGKTALAASYLTASDASSVWCQIDEGDADPATFFFFLSEAVQGTGPALPWLAPEVSGDIPRFARLFFREYYARLPAGAIVVLDNIQEFDWEGCGELMEIAFSEVPEGITILALSRNPPPARLARLELDGRLAILGWGALRLNRDEALALAQLSESDDGNSLAMLDQIDGWAAGVVMLREHAASPRSEATVPQLDGRERVFRYFAGEILGQMPDEWQRLLLLLSGLPGISAEDAQQLTGDPAAGQVLHELFHHRLFTDRRGAAPFTYHFHALFREFLQYEAQRRLSSHERTALLERAATILDAQGRTEEAARLYGDAGAYAQLAGLLQRSASRMMASGRGQSWREWMGWLPPDVVAAEPWLWYWQGVSLNRMDPVLGRQVLARAEQAFHAAGDTRARLLAIAAILDGYFYEWSDLHALEQWTNAMLDAMQSVDAASLDADSDLKIHSRIVLGLFLDAPDSPMLAWSAQRALQALPNVRDPAERLAAGAILLMYLNWGNVTAARALARMLDPLVSDPVIDPFHRISWCRSAVYRHQFDGRYAEAQQLAEYARRLIADFGLEHLQFQLNFRMGLNLIGMGDLEGARELLARMRQLLLPARKLELVYLRILEACYFTQLGNVRLGRAAVEEAIRLGEEARLNVTTRWQIDMLHAAVLAQAGELDAAREWSARAIERACGPDKESAAEHDRFIAAYDRYCRGDRSSAIPIVEELFRSLRQREANLPIMMTLVPHMASTLCFFALQEGIEVPFVRGLVTKHRMAPPSVEAGASPWPLAIRSFGNFVISVNGEPLAVGGKAQRRPLSLLKALLVAGPAGKTQQSLAVQLWPDSDDAKGALNVTVHRLRKLLGRDDAIVVASGTVTLNDSVAWTDVAALAILCDRIGEAACDAQGSEIGQFAAGLLDLYRGPFSEGDEDSWLLPAREGWRNRFLAAAAALGERLEQMGEWKLAHQLYTRSLEAEPLAETSYRGIMRCASAQGDTAAAFSAYRRCRETLSIVLSQKPSAETEKLALALGLKAT